MDVRGQGAASRRVSDSGTSDFENKPAIAQTKSIVPLSTIWGLTGFLVAVAGSQKLCRFFVEMLYMEHVPYDGGWAASRTGRPAADQ